MGLTVYAARHAPTDVVGRCIGRTDVLPRLTPDEAADRIGASLPARPDVVWSSPLVRCSSPASRLATRFEVPHRVDDRLFEVDFGAWEGRAWSDIEAEDADALAHWMADWERAAPPGGEAVPALEARVLAWLESLAPGIHLLVGHAGVIRALRVLAGATWADAMRAPVPHLEIEGPLARSS